jgi:hypothetical protein
MRLSWNSPPGLTFFAIRLAVYGIGRGAMNFPLATTFLAFIAVTSPQPRNWCIVGHTVMVPDGREGPVTALDGDMCEVLVYGDGQVSRWAYYSIEPVYPQRLESYAFGH